MGLLGISLLVASVVYVILRPPPWIPPHFILWKGLLPSTPSTSPRDAGTEAEKLSSAEPPPARTEPGLKNRQNGETRPTDHRPIPSASDDLAQRSLSNKRADAGAMPPPPRPPVLVQPPTLAEPDSDEQTTPKAQPAVPSLSVPSFSLADDSQPSAPPRATPAAPAGMMLPPPVPGRMPPAGRMPSAGRVPGLAQFPAANSAQRARGPVPNRGMPSTGGSGLAPPPTHSAKPSKPSRQVLLTPGHSPLDWARISGPNADLRGAAAGGSYLRVTPSMLKYHTGRKGKDAWMALNGKVYNVTPYADFHPGGVPELMRGAGRDGTKLFGEIHPWVNYETMLSACLIGLLVEETEGTQSVMDEMD